MTGKEFQEKLKETGYSQRQLAERWGVSHTTIQRVCQAQEVRGLYADAIRQVYTKRGT
jgi:transposase